MIKNKITQKDVAELAGVNQTVVSAVMRGDLSAVRVSEETRSRVIKAADSLGYSINSGARALRQGLFRAIGYFITSHSEADFDYPEYRAGLVDAAIENQFRVTLVRLNIDNQNWLESLKKFFKESSIDALVVHHSVMPAPKLDRWLASSGLPVVFLNEKLKHNCVACDDKFGVTSLHTHILERGYKRPLYVKVSHHLTEIAPHVSLPDREKHFLRLCARTNLHAASVSFTPGSSKEDFEAALRKWRPDILVCESDAAALYTQNLAFRAGILPGRDIAICGYNDEDTCRFMAVPLTTVSVPRYQMARAAVQMAIRLATKKTSAPEKALTYQPALVVRDSTPPLLRWGAGRGAATHTRHSRAFTMIELLVTIAIIIVLTAISLPMINNSVRTARETAGIANLKQITTATITYTQDNDGFLPYGRFTFGHGGDFRTQVSSHMAGKGGDGTYWDPDAYNPVFKDPSAHKKGGDLHFTANPAVMWFASNPGEFRTRFISITRPSEVILFFDGAQIPAYGWSVEAVGWAAAGGMVNPPSYLTTWNAHLPVPKGPNEDAPSTTGNIRWRNRNDTTAKFSFADGRVMLLKPEDLRRLNFYPQSL